MSKKRFYRFVYWVGFLFILTVTSSGQGVYEAWVASYNGPGNYDDYASALAIDASGNVYVTGRTWSGTSFDYATIKYDSNGDSLWVRHYNGPPDYYDYASALAVALAVDASGNVHVTGTSWNGLSYDYATIKYDSNGDSLWVRRYKGPGGNYGEAAPALAVDASGNVYVTGSSYCCGPGGSFNYTTIKYNSNGNLLWERHYNGPGNDYPDNIDIASALAVDASGNVYVTGRSYGSGTNYDYATIKYAPNGDTLWVRRYNGPGNGFDEAIALAVDDSGNVYVTGQSGGAGTNSDYATIKYADNGDSLWVRRYNGPSNSYDDASALAIDASGNVYVTGRSWSGTSYDYATIKYDSNGDTLWVRRYNGPGNGFDEAIALAIDASGNVYVTGRSWSGTSYDYATIKYDSNGDTLWVRRYNGPSNSYDDASALAIDASGNVYVTGETVVEIYLDYATVKYSPCSAIPGDVNSSGTITLGDIVHLLNYLFDRDNPPCIGIDPGNCWDFGLTCRGDVNNSASITLGDVVHLLNYVFDRDNPPCLGIDPGNCWTPEQSGGCCQPLP